MVNACISGRSSSATFFTLLPFSMGINSLRTKYNRLNDIEFFSNNQFILKSLNSLLVVKLVSNKKERERKKCFRTERSFAERQIGRVRLAVEMVRSRSNKTRFKLS